MSTLQSTAHHHHRARTGALALGTLIAIGLALLILIPTGHATSSTKLSSIPQPLSHAAPIASIPLSGGCFRDPGTHALTCSHAAPAYPDTPNASTSYFRDPVTHKLLGKPVRHRLGVG
jgi:hypothetical protein